MSAPSPSTPETSTWLPPLPISLDRSTWTYTLTDGPKVHRFPISVTGVISAVTKTPEQKAQIMSTQHIWGPRGNTTHKALETFVNNKWNPTIETLEPLSTIGDDGNDYSDYITPLLNHPIWQKVTPVASERTVYCLKRNVAGTVDLILKFNDGSYGIADLKTQGRPTDKPYDTKPQLGAGVHMAGDRYRLYFSRCLTIWARPGEVQIQTHDAQACLDAWWATLDTYEARFRPF